MPSSNFIALQWKEPLECIHKGHILVLAVLVHVKIHFQTMSQFQSVKLLSMCCFCTVIQ